MAFSIHLLQQGRLDSLSDHLLEYLIWNDFNPYPMRSLSIKKNQIISLVQWLRLTLDQFITPDH